MGKVVAACWGCAMPPAEHALCEADTAMAYVYGSQYAAKAQTQNPPAPLALTT